MDRVPIFAPGNWLHDETAPAGAMFASAGRFTVTLGGGRFDRHFHDMAELSRRGTAVMLISSGPFINLARAQAQVFGIPGLSLIEIPHPLGGIRLAEVRARAEVAATEILRILKTKAS